MKGDHVDEEVVHRNIIYEIIVEGWLDESWTDWLNGTTITYGYDHVDSPITTFTRAVPDQVALRGILNKIWDMNLELVAVSRVEAV